MYYGTLIILWNFSNALAIPILGLNNENKYYNPNHQYNISWDYDQLNKPVMTLQNVYDFKMTSIWAFLIGMLAAFGFICIFWIIIYKGMSTNNEDKLKPQKSKKKCSCFNCFKGKPQLKECPAQRHKYPLFSFKRSPKPMT